MKLFGPSTVLGGMYAKRKYNFHVSDVVNAMSILKINYTQESLQDILKNDDFLQEFDDVKKKTIEYRRKALNGFLFCAKNRPSIYEVERALERNSKGKATRRDLEILSLEDRCTDDDHAWHSSLAGQAYWNFFYQVKNLGQELGWSEEKITKEGAALLLQLLKMRRKKEKKKFFGELDIISWEISEI